jgi:hypothetical protein
LPSTRQAPPSAFSPFGQRDAAEREASYFSFLDFLSRRFFGSFGFLIRSASATPKQDPHSIRIAVLLLNDLQSCASIHTSLHISFLTVSVYESINKSHSQHLDRLAAKEHAEGYSVFRCFLEGRDRDLNPGARLHRPIGYQATSPRPLFC